VNPWDESIFRNDSGGKISVATQIMLLADWFYRWREK
jgi:hypothetical protein